MQKHSDILACPRFSSELSVPDFTAHSLLEATLLSPGEDLYEHRPHQVKLKAC